MPDEPPTGEGNGGPEFTDAAAHWLRRAQSNLARAKSPMPEGTLIEDFCFDAQQAAEKALKAVLVLKGIDPPRTHDLSSLIGLLRRSGVDVPEPLDDADQLNEYAVEGRYPDPERVMTAEMLHEAITVAERVFRWASDALGGSGEHKPG